MTHTETELIDDNDVNLWQIAEFLMDHAKLLLLGGLVGAILGLGGWSAWAPYKGKLVLNVEKLGNNRSSIDYMTWRSLEQNLPLLALQMIESGKIKDETLLDDYKAFSKQEWWQQNVVPTYALTKADAKSLFAINKELQDAEANTILNIVITERQGSTDAVLHRLNQSADFIQQGAAFLAIKSLVRRYQSESANIASLQQQITQNEVELRYLQERAKRFELLRLKFPQSKVISSQQVLEISEANAKYMPFESQLIAVYSEIDRIEEQISRLTLALAQLELKSQFVTLGVPLMEAEANGLVLVERLVGITSNLRGKLRKGDQNSLLTLGSIDADLFAVKTQFGNGLTKNPVTKPVKSSFLIPTFGGFLGTGFVMLMWLILRQGWARYRAGKVGAGGTVLPA